MAEPVRAVLVGVGRRSEPDELESSINLLIERRAANREHADEQEESWKESERQHHAEEREANRHAWRAYYHRLARNHAGLSEHFEGKAAALSWESADSQPTEGDM